jgi:hypothetical protein
MKKGVPLMVGTHVPHMSIERLALMSTTLAAEELRLAAHVAPRPAHVRQLGGREHLDHDRLFLAQSDLGRPLALPSSLQAARQTPREI